MQKIIDFIIPIGAGLVSLVFAIVGYQKAKKDSKKKKTNIMGMILGGSLIVLSLILIFVF